MLKDEFYLDQTFENLAQAKKAAKNTINLYNKIRLHLSLELKSPNMIYKLSNQELTLTFIQVSEQVIKK
jgi:putative transposase